MQDCGYCNTLVLVFVESVRRDQVAALEGTHPEDAPKTELVKSTLRRLVISSVNMFASSPERSCRLNDGDFV